MQCKPAELWISFHFIMGYQPKEVLLSIQRNNIYTAYTEGSVLYELILYLNLLATESLTS